MIKYENCPSITIYEMFLKCERHLLWCKRIGWRRKLGTSKDRMLKDILTKTIQYAKEDYDIDIKILEYNYKDKDWYNILKNSGKFDLVIEDNMLIESNMPKEQWVDTSCFIDNSDLRIGQNIPDVYNPLWWLSKEDIEKYKKWSGIE